MREPSRGGYASTVGPNLPGLVPIECTGRLSSRMNPRLFHRREVLRTLVGGSLLMPGILSKLLAESGSNAADPLAPKPSPYRAKAKRVIFIFSNGGVSQMDTFDPKPALFAADGKKLGIGGGLSNQQKVLLKPLWH